MSPNQTQKSQKKAAAPKAKGAVRAKSGCYTCRIRRKKCDEQQNKDGHCQTCIRLRLECLGFGVKRPDWLRDNRNVLDLREKIKTHLAAQGMIKGHSGTGGARPGDAAEPPVLRLQEEYGAASTASPPTPTLSLDDHRPHGGLAMSAMRDDYTLIEPFVPHNPELSPDSPPRSNVYAASSNEAMLPPYESPQSHVSSLQSPHHAHHNLVPVVPSWPSHAQHATHVAAVQAASPAVASSFGPLYGYNALMESNYDDDEQQQQQQYYDAYAVAHDPGALTTAPTTFFFPGAQLGLHLHDELVAHYAARVFNIQYLLADPAVHTLVMGLLDASATARAAVQLLAGVHRANTLQPGLEGAVQGKLQELELALIPGMGAPQHPAAAAAATGAYARGSPGQAQSVYSGGSVYGGESPPYGQQQAVYGGGSPPYGNVYGDGSPPPYGNAYGGAALPLAQSATAYGGGSPTHMYGAYSGDVPPPGGAGLLQMYEAGDAMAALHVVSVYLFNGGQGKWEQWIGVACRFSEVHLRSPAYAGPEDALARCDATVRFIIKTTLWFDVLAAASQLVRPYFLDVFRAMFRPPAARIDGLVPCPPPALDMLEVMGCENHVVWALAEISALARWKEEQARAGRLSTPELVRRGAEIEACLALATQHAAGYGSPPPPAAQRAAAPQPLPRHPLAYHAPRHAARGGGGGGGGSALAYERWLTSEVFRAGARVYLHSVLSGDFPHCGEIHQGVAETVAALRSIPPSNSGMSRTVVRSVVFSIFVCGCLTDDAEQRSFLCKCLENEKAEAVGNCSQVLNLMKAVWEARRKKGPNEPVPWRDMLRKSRLLLV